MSADLLGTETPPETPAPVKPPRRAWRYILLGVIALAVVVTGAFHGLGTKGGLIALGIGGGVVLLGGILWRLPHLRRHFARPRGAARRMTRTTRTFGGGKGILGRLGSGRRGTTAGRRTGSLPGGRKTGRGRSGKGVLGKLTSGRRGTTPKLTGRTDTAGRKGLFPKLGGKTRSGPLKGATGRRRGGSAAGGRKGILGRLRGKPTSAARKTTGSGTRTRPGPLAKGVRRAAGKLWPGKTPTTAKIPPSSGPRAKPGRLARGVLGAWRQARTRTGTPKGGKTRRAVATVAAIPLLPVAGAVALIRRIRHGKPAPASPAVPKVTRLQPATPAPGPAPDRQPGPGLAPSTTIPEGTPAMSSAIDAAVEAIHDHLGSWEPQNATEIGSFLQGLPDLYEALGDALTRVADRFGDELPVHSSVSEHLREMASQSAGLREYAEEAHSQFRNSHEVELSRLENPRHGEGLWDVAAQD